VSTFITVRAHGPAFIGGALDGEVLLETERTIDTRSIVVTLVGRESANRLGVDFWRARALLGGSARLGPGMHRFRFRFVLPGLLPPTFASPWASIKYTLTVDVDRPWWPDPRHTAELVLAPPPVPVQLRPHRFRLASRDPAEPPPFDVSLNSTGFGPGDLLVGKVALSPNEARRSTGVRVRLAGQVGLHAKTHWINAVSCEQLAGHFALRIPAVTTAFATTRIDLRWYLEIESLRLLGGGPSGRIPVTVLPRQWDRELPQELPAVGDGWREEELAGLQRAVAVGDSTIEIGTVGSELRGTLRFPDLHLGLTRSRRGKLRARFDEHARAIAWAVATDPGIALLELDDRHLVASALYGTGAAFQVWLRQVAARLDETRRTLMPPAAHQAQLPTWRALAAALEGRLEPGALFVHGARGLPVSVATIWDGQEAAGMRIEVDASPLPVRFEDSERVLVLDGQGQGVEEVLAEIDRLVAALRSRAHGTPFR
jgi:hypothetical protein